MLRIKATIATNTGERVRLHMISPTRSQALEFIDTVFPGNASVQIVIERKAKGGTA